MTPGERRLRSRDWFDNRERMDMTALYLERFMNYGVTPEEVIAGAIKCLRATFDEHKLGSYELRIQAKPDDKTNWRRHEARYGPRKKR